MAKIVLKKTEAAALGLEGTTFEVPMRQTQAGDGITAAGGRKSICTTDKGETLAVGLGYIKPTDAQAPKGAL